MRAVVLDGFGGPEVLRIAEVPDPSPGPGEVLVDVAATAVNRADLLQRQGHYPPPPGSSDVLGLECSGTVAALGEGVTGWRRGDHVCALLAGGGYATRVAVPAAQCLPVPRGIVSDVLGVDRERVRAWALVWCVESAAWSYDVGDVRSAADFERAADLILA